MITGISGFGFFCPKMAVSWRITVFQKLVCWNPIFIVFWGCAFSGPSCQKKGIFGQKPKKKFLTDNWKAHFLTFFVFFVLSIFLFLFFFVVFGGFKGQVRWPEGPPHLALNPPYWFCLFVCLFFLVVFSFLSLLLSEKKPIFPIKKAFFCLFLSVSLCFSWAFFWASTCSISLSLSLSCSFLSFFLLVFLVLLSFGSLFFSRSFFFCLLCFLFHETNNIKRFNCKVFLHQSCVFFGFLSCFLFQIPFSYLCFSWYSVMSFVQHQCFWFQKTQVEKHQFLVKRGVATKRVF